ncbi:MAG: MFS transporter [Thermosynechococcaceae cyanobacterium]
MKSAEQTPQDISGVLAADAIAPEPNPIPSPKLAKDSIRTSLTASTADGVFAAIFTNLTSGVLLINFLMDLGASATQVGLLAAIPLVANLVQPLGAYVSEQTVSRHWYCLTIYVPSRLLWLFLLGGIGGLDWGQLDSQTLIYWTLAIALCSALIGALGSAAWLSWMAILVPRRLRGRYFGLRNSAANLTNLATVPLAGLVIARWTGGSIAGFAVVLGVGIVCGMVSLKFQDFMADVNPTLQRSLAEPETVLHTETVPVESQQPEGVESQSLGDYWHQNSDFWMFLVYFSVWMFSVNLSAPFFNLYLLGNLHLNISQVTLYNSLMAGANLSMLMVWGRLADRVGNRPLLMGVGLVMALTPLLWLFVGTDQLSIWLWLPLLHVLMGGAAAAIDLCSNNLQIGVAPVRNQSTYFGWIAAAAGVSGAIGTTLGGYLAEHWQVGGLLGLFIVSSVCRVGALFPLLFVQEHRSVSLRQLVQVFAATHKPVSP